MSIDRHPGESRDRGLPGGTVLNAPRGQRSRIKSGTTAVLTALALAGCAVSAQENDAGETGAETPTGSAPAANPAGPPAAAPAAGGPPPAPKPITVASRPGATGGEALYLEHCMSCHGPNGMGTGLLGRRLDTALLEARDNLAAQYVIVAARQGIGNMPPIPRGEVSDEELQAIADYLAAGPHEVAQ
jgi:mono/diheme cytochrome c family protein